MPGQSVHASAPFLWTLYGVHQNRTAMDRYNLYGNTVIGTLAVDGWAVTFGTARRDLGELRPSSLYQM